MAAKTSTAAADTAASTAAEGYDKSYWEEKIDWTVPMDLSNPHDRTLFISVNGHFFKMRRGDTVSVPRYVVEQYNQQQRQIVNMLKLQDKLAKNVELNTTESM